MPNHVQNIVVISGRDEDVNRLIKEVKYSPDTHDAETAGPDTNTLDFNKVVPMPRLLNASNYGYCVELIGAYASYVNPKYFGIDDAIEGVRPTKLDKEVFKQIEEFVKENYLAKDKDCTRLTSEQLKNLANNITMSAGHLCEAEKEKEYTAKDIIGMGAQLWTAKLLYGTYDWYNWCCAHWGTKWNSYRHEKGEPNQIIFQTAWSTPMPVIKKLSELYPDTTIETYYADEDIGNNCGKYTYRPGKLIEDWCPGDEEAEKYANDVWNLAIEAYSWY